ncbi:hypothetical protein L1987_70186 [Smallanthus sonchifolius]|uniref:Uncharacterized protein n=1 Tax=Smallanthus sonchifolius TaxID=185202 RepID=A0ACB9ANB6_9ASTR|nr:hypothetical protein L1987_70186 [Smallanthus sonchifolius]
MPSLMLFTVEQFLIYHTSIARRSTTGRHAISISACEDDQLAADTSTWMFRCRIPVHYCLRMTMAKANKDVVWLMQDWLLYSDDTNERMLYWNTKVVE